MTDKTNEAVAKAAGLHLAALLASLYRLVWHMVLGWVSAACLLAFNVHVPWASLGLLSYVGHGYLSYLVRDLTHARTTAQIKAAARAKNEETLALAKRMMADPSILASLGGTKDAKPAATTSGPYL